MGEDVSICVVDDDRSVRQAIRSLLESVGMAVEDFSSAEDFLDYAADGSVGCLILDVRMPGIGGLDLFQILEKRGRNIPVVFVTGHGDVPMSVRAMKQGAIDFLQKPFNEQELLDAVGKALEEDRTRSEVRQRAEAVAARIASLTPRELEVMKLIVEGYSNREVGRILGAAENTVKIHRARVMKKMEAGSLPELVRLAAVSADPGSSG
jgi:FixJ family two-component response regulator